MILEGIELPEPSDVSQSLKRLAASVIEAGPPKLSAEDVRKLRYQVTSLTDDVRQPRSKDEPFASGAELYEKIPFSVASKAGMNNWLIGFKGLF